MVRYIVLAAAVAAAGCGSTGSDTSRPVVTATVEALTSEYGSDPAAFHTKYGSCRVEITGTVESVRSDDVKDAVIHVRLTSQAGPDTKNPVDVSFHLSQEPKLLPLVPGSTVTVRGNADSEGLTFVSGELVKADPVATTDVSTIAVDAKDPAGFRRKYTDGGLRVIGKVLEVRRKPLTIPRLTEVEIWLYDGTDQEKPIVCRIRTSERTDQRYRVVSLRRGETISVIGRVATVDPAGKEILTLEPCHIVP
jgi:hypothetical protein